MKYFLALILFIPVLAFAAPFGEATGTITSDMVCHMQDTGGTDVTVAPSGSPLKCRWDLAGVATGPHSGNVWLTNIWGAGPMLPFSYTKGVPGALSGFSIVAQ